MNRIMNRLTNHPFSWRQALGQLACYAAFMSVIGFFASAPTYRHLPADKATVKLSLRHAGQLLGECRQRSPEELAALPANMRVPSVCPRERSALVLELDLNGKPLYSEILAARGIHKDGRTSVYERLTIPTGSADITVRLKDHIDSQDFQYQATRNVQLATADNLVIDFNEETQAFEFLLKQRSAL